MNQKHAWNTWFASVRSHSYQGLRCSTGHFCSLKYFCFLGLCERWLVCPECQRSPRADEPGRWQWTVPSANRQKHPACWVAGNRREIPFHENVWLTTTECWSYAMSYPMQWSLGGKKTKNLLYKVNFLHKAIVKWNEYVLSFVLKYPNESKCHF